jgi:hypothetical protein
MPGQKQYSRQHKLKGRQGRDADCVWIGRPSVRKELCTQLGTGPMELALACYFMIEADMRLQVEYFKKQRVVNYQKEQTIKKIEAEGGEIIAPQLPTKK